MEAERRHHTFMKVTVTPKLFLILIVLTIIASGVLAVFTTRTVRNVAQDSLSQVLIERTQQQTTQLLDPRFFSTAPHDVEAASGFRSFFSAIRGERALRIKMWSRDAIILFSDEQSIIGEAFPENPEFQSAISGIPTASFNHKEKAEHASEGIFRNFIEVYVPVAFVHDTSPVGVVEVYYDSTLFEGNLRRAEIFLFAISLAVPLMLLLITAVFFRVLVITPLQKLQREMRELMKSL